MWGKTLAFIILFIFTFGFLVALIPDTFSGATIQDAEVTEEIAAANLIVYTNAGSDETFLGYTSLEDAPEAPQWKIQDREDYVEIWFDSLFISGNSLQLRQVYKFASWWENPEWFHIYYLDGSEASQGVQETSVGQFELPRDALLTAWDSEKNCSAFTAKTTSISVSIIFKFNTTSYSDIGAAFDDGILTYALSYEWNPDNTGFAVMNIIISLLTFRGIGVGVPGQIGVFIDTLISTLFYVAIIVVAYIIITSIIPLVAGAPD